MAQERIGELLDVDLRQQMPIEGLSGSSSALHDRYIDTQPTVLRMAQKKVRGEEKAGDK